MRHDGRDPHPSNTLHVPLNTIQEGWLGRLCDWFVVRKALGLPMDGGAQPQPNLSSDRLTRKEAAMSQDHKQQVRVHIRWMIRRDMAEVLGIERQSFEFPWFEEDFIRCLRQRNCIGMVAEHGERVVGFMIYELHKTRLHILNFAVADNCRGQGIGRQMAEKLVGKLSSQRRTRITLEVRETNLPAQLFFKHVGFRATNVLRSYYEDSPEDAYVMQFHCGAEELVEAETTSTRRIDRLAG